MPYGKGTYGGKVGSPKKKEEKEEEVIPDWVTLIVELWLLFSVVSVVLMLIYLIITDWN